MPRGNLTPLGHEIPLAEARLTARKLQEAGIPSFLRGEAAALISADPDGALVRIEVDEEDLEHAGRVLAGPSVEAVVASSEDVEAGDGLATVEVFYDSLEAKHAADLLRARGIPCALRGTSEGTLSWLAPNVARLRLEVHESDLERAFEILGFTVEDREAVEGSYFEAGEDLPAHRTAAAEHIQEASPTPSSPVQRHPVQSPGEAGAPASPTPAPAERLTVPVPPPSVEAGKGGGEASLLVFLLLVAGAVLVLGVLLMF